MRKYVLGRREYCIEKEKAFWSPANVESTEFRRQRIVDIKELVRERGKPNWILLTDSHHFFPEVITQESDNNGSVRY